MKFYTGFKLFKFHKGKDTPEIIRVLNVYEDKKRIEYINPDGEIKKMTFKEARSYNILAPDGLLLFCTPKVADDTDVAVVLTQFPKSGISMKTNECEPYAICRQLAVDVFSTIANGGNMAYGISVSIDTCPSNLDFKIFFDNENIGYKKNVAVYLDDTLDTILNLVDQHKFDSILESLHNKYHAIFGGFSKRLKELLEENKFMYDFRRCFDILEVPFSIDGSIDFLSDINTQYLMSTLGIQIIDTYMVKYSKEIDTREFNREYILVTSAADNHDSVYIVCFDKA